jgi:hypothetical protein
MDSQATTVGISSVADANPSGLQGLSSDIEMSPVPEGAGMERAPPLDHSIEVVDPGSSQQGIENATTAGGQDLESNILAEAWREPPAIDDQDRELMTNLLRTLMSSMLEKHAGTFKHMSMEELQAFKRQCSVAFDAPALSEILASLKSSPDSEQIIDAHLLFYDYCGPLLFQKKIVELKMYRNGYQSDEHPEFTGPVAQFSANGLYLGETIEQLPCGFGLWVSIETRVEREGSKQKPVSVTIMGGHWSDTVCTGAMLRLCFPPESTVNVSGGTLSQRCVGFSYRGTFALTSVDKSKIITFDCPNAVFREFEVAVPLPQDGQFPLQLWHELFIDSLSDDGFERQQSRDVFQHSKALGLKFSMERTDAGDFINFLKDNYIGGGLQYFVPKIAVEGRPPLLALRNCYYSYHQFHCTFMTIYFDV